MTLSLTRDGATVITPYMVLGYSFSRDSANIRHDIIGTDPEMTLRPLGPATSTLQFLCLTATDAFALVAFLSVVGVFTLADTDVPEAALTFVLAAGGKVTRELDPDTRRRWIVSLEAQGV